MKTKEAHSLAQYIINFIEYELIEHNKTFHPDMIREATEAYLGGAR